MLSMPAWPPGAWAGGPRGRFTGAYLNHRQRGTSGVTSRLGFIYIYDYRSTFLVWWGDVNRVSSIWSCSQISGACTWCNPKLRAGCTCEFACDVARIIINTYY